jgi:hypothetical protein
MRLKERIATLQRKADEGQGQLVEKPSDRRWANRKPGVVSARLLCDSFREPVMAVVRDMSATGAKIQVEPKRLGPIQSTSDIPDIITLVLRNEQTEVLCKVMWRTVDHIGVRFQSAIRPTSFRERGPVRKKA